MSEYSQAYKENKIKSIKKEVPEFHPLLKDLFSRMNGIEHLEYTHGPNEDGADFILEIRHGVLPNEYNYVGVIVKCGKVDKKFLSEKIILQIRECYIPKMVKNGSETRNIKEVWIITNDTFSHGAKNFINGYNEFKGKNIIFFGNQELLELIDKNMPEYWSYVNVEISTNLKELRTQIEAEEKAKSILSLPNGKDVYIKPRLINRSFNINDKSNKVNKTEKEIDIYNLINKGCMIIVEAQMGAGKSKLLRNICLKYTNIEDYNKNKIFPIYVSFNKFINDFNGNIENLLTRYQFYETNKDTKFLIALDGMDEVEINNMNEVLYHIENWCLSTKNPVIITTRYNNFTDIEFNKQISYKVSIAPLSTKELFNFIKELCNNIDNRLFDDISKSQLMLDLPKSPFAAILLVQLLNENLNELPANLPELYRKYMELVLGRWDIDKGLTTSNNQIILEKILMIFSEYLINNNVLELKESEFDNIIKEYIDSRNINYTLENIKNDLVKKSKIISINKNTSSVMFSHKSFLDFFYAKYAIDSNPLNIDEKLFSFYWSNICYFYIGLKLDCEDILSKLINIKPTEEILRVMKMITLPNFLMAGYHTPYKIIEDNLDKIMIETSILFRDIINSTNGNFGFFSSASELFILWLFQSLIDDFYSYKFFKKAIMKSFTSLIDYKDDDEIRAYSMLFLSVISLRLDITEVLELFFEEYKDNMPIPIQIIIAYHVDDIIKLNSDKEASYRIKKRLNKMKKYIKKLDKNYIKSILKISIENRNNKS